MKTQPGSSAPKRDLVVTRLFDAPIEMVWKAWIDPEQVMRWRGLDGFTSPSPRIDFREGGTSLVCMCAPEDFGGQDLYSTWTYTKIVPMERIEYIHNLADKDGGKADPVALGFPPNFLSDQRHTVTFKAMTRDKTKMTVTEYEWRVGRMLEFAETALNECLDKMAAAFRGEKEMDAKLASPPVILCDQCKEKRATVFMTQIFQGGESKKQNLCESCGEPEMEKAFQEQAAFLRQTIESHSSPDDPIGITARECERLMLINRDEMRQWRTADADRASEFRSLSRRSSSHWSALAIIVFEPEISSDLPSAHAQALR